MSMPMLVRKVAKSLGDHPRKAAAGAVRHQEIKRNKDWETLGPRSRRSRLD